MERATSMSCKMVNVQHRHCVFTICVPRYATSPERVLYQSSMFHLIYRIAQNLYILFIMAGEYDGFPFFL